MKNSGKPQKTSATATTQPINRTLHYALSSIIMLSTSLPGYLAAQENSDQKAKEKPEKSEKIITLSTLSVIGGLNDSVSAGSSVLKKSDIERTQADNIAELLDQLPGVSMSGSPRPGGQTLNIWGMGDTEDVKVTLDDAPKGFEKYLQGSIFIEPELIKRVDVDKGPHNLLDGNGGFGGTVKVVTKDASDLLRPGEDFGGLLKYSYHTNDRQHIYSSAIYGRTIEGFADGLLYMSKRDGGNIKRPDGTRFAFSKSDQASYLLKTNFYLNDTHTLTLSAMRSESNGWQPWAAKRDEIAVPSEADVEKYGWNEAWRRKLVYRDQTDQNYTAKWNIAPEDNPLLNLTATYAYSKTEQHDKRSKKAHNGFIGSLGNESWIGYVDHLVDINNKSDFITGPIEHTLLAGVRWHKNQRNTLIHDKSKDKRPEYNYGYFQPTYMPSGEQKTNSFYLQDTMVIGSVTVTPGVRYDHITNIGKPNIAAIYNDNSPNVGHDYSNVTYTGWSPHFGIMWKATQNLSLFSDISRTWRAPLVDEQYEMQYAQASITATSRNLDVERITGLRFGAILNFNSLLADRDSLQIRTTLFRNRGKDEIFVRRGIVCKLPDCEKPLSNYRNLPGYTIQGLEIETFYDSNYLFGKLSYSTIRGQRDASPRDPWGNKTWIAEIPPTSARAMLGIKIPQWQMAMGWTGDFVRKQDRSPKDGDPMAILWSIPKSQGYTLHGLFASWQPDFWQGLEARVTINNLFNRDYKPYLGESVSGVGRNIKFSISQKF
ncbi:TonB-dependent hemoglobin/transferrin/lactoferrin family receptor [Photorhabdus asymbiotica]|uniref:TonB-dependent hemoglobin/transferrin/lactoferrin family receptor n=1 Tax=Photorhabdus asymbiotica TaxID=291112 RepID=UPI003DA74315